LDFDAVGDDGYGKSQGTGKTTSPQCFSTLPLLPSL
jgi:hypothetical protein